MLGTVAFRAVLQLDYNNVVFELDKHMFDLMSTCSQLLHRKSSRHPRLHFEGFDCYLFYTIHFVVTAAANACTLFLRLGLWTPRPKLR